MQASKVFQAFLGFGDDDDSLFFTFFFSFFHNTKPHISFGSCGSYWSSHREDEITKTTLLRNNQVKVTMSNVVGDVIIASVQSVAKVYVIGAIGYFSVKCEFHQPPATNQGRLQRFTVHTSTAPATFVSSTRLT